MTFIAEYLFKNNIYFIEILSVNSSKENSTKDSEITFRLELLCINVIRLVHIQRDETVVYAVSNAYKFCLIKL